MIKWAFTSSVGQRRLLPTHHAVRLHDAVSGDLLPHRPHSAGEGDDP